MLSSLAGILACQTQDKQDTELCRPRLYVLLCHTNQMQLETGGPPGGKIKLQHIRWKIPQASCSFTPAAH